MIPKRAVAAFEARPRDNCRYYKNLSNTELEKLCDELPVRPPIWQGMHAHQKACFLMGTDLKRAGFFLDTGMGKTLLSLALMHYFHRQANVRTSIVLVPYRINKSEWVREIRKHSPKTTYCVLTGSTNKKWDLLDDTDAMVYIDTYGGFTRMMTKMEPHPKKKDKGRLVLDHKRVRAMIKRIQGVYLDESSGVANSGALVTRVCRQLSKVAKVFIALTGTPFGRDPTALWSQLFLIDKGYSLGETLGLFRAAFFTESENLWGGKDYKFKTSKQKRLNRFLAHSTIRYEANASDLPKLVQIIKEVTLPHDAQGYYDRVMDDLRESQGNYTETKNAFLKMRQISSGFLGYNDDDEGIRAQIELHPNPKLQLLMSLVDRVVNDHKVLVFHDFRFTGAMIARELKKQGIGHVRLSHLTKDPEALLHTFDHDPDVRCFVLSTAGAYGLNLQIAKYGFFYESPVPVILRKQMLRRYERQGTKHSTVFLYDLICRGTVDQRILDFHKQGADLFEAIIEGKSHAHALLASPIGRSAR